MKSKNTTLNQSVYLEITAQIVSAFLSKNAISVDQISETIHSVHDAIVELNQPKEPETVKLKPAVPISKSVTPHAIICLEDGKHLKMLKRHLKAAYGMTPQEYRVKWGLPTDYPMTAPAYAAERSQLAKKLGLGRKATASK